MSDYWDDLEELERQEALTYPEKLSKSAPAEPPDRLAAYKERVGHMRLEPLDIIPW